MTSMLKQIDIHAHGLRIKDVQCEKCQTQFGYQLQRSAKGSATGFRFSQNKDATRRADDAAITLLTKLLDEQDELVPCPVCQWVNQDMINHYRKEKHGYRLSTYVMAAIIGFPCTCILGPLLMWPIAALIPKNSSSQVAVGILMLIITFSGLFLPLLMKLNVSRKRKAIQPNLHWPDGPPILPKNTPAALLPIDVDEEGQIIYESF